MRVNHRSVVVYGSEMTWFLRAGRKWLRYGVGIDRIGFRVHGCKWLCFGFTGRNLLDVGVNIELDLVFPWVVEYYSISVWGIKIDWI